MKEVKEYFKSLKDYRHWIMIAFIVASIALIPFFFRYAHLRIWESCVAFGNSCKFWFSEFFDLGLHGDLTVNDFTQQPFELPLHLPRTWEEFKTNLSGYADNVFTIRGLQNRIATSTDTLSNAEIENIVGALTRNNATDISKREHIKSIHETQRQIAQNICPRCNAPLVLRKGKYGDFYGCSNYPKCKFTKDI